MNWRPCVNDPLWQTMLRLVALGLGIVLAIAALAAPFVIVKVLVWYRGAFA